MAYEKNVIIIGGGLQGVCTLYELSRRGVQALLLERCDRLAAEASFANGGLLTPSSPDPWNSPGVGTYLLRAFFDKNAAMKLRATSLPEYARWGLEFLSSSRTEPHKRAIQANYVLAQYSTLAADKIQEELGLAYKRSVAGSLKIFDSEENLSKSLEAAELFARHGLKYEALSRDAAIEKEPQLSNIGDRIIGALFYPDDRSGDAKLFVSELAAKAVECGGQIRTATGVKRLACEKNRVVGVVTDEGEVLSGDVVLATGAYSLQLARTAGLWLPVKPVKGYSLTFDIDGLDMEPPRIAVIDDAMHAAVTPLGRQIRIVGTAEFSGFNKKVRRDRIANLYGLFQRIYPHLANELPVSSGAAWAGLRPVSADGRPFIGKSPRGGLWLNCGHGHLGWTQAFGSARLLSALMLGEEPEFACDPFAFKRI